MNQLKQVLTTTGFFSREPYVINICCAYFQTETSWQLSVISFLTMNELQDNALFCSGFLIVLLLRFFPHIYAFFGIQTLPVLFLESINWF